MPANRAESPQHHAERRAEKHSPCRMESVHTMTGTTHAASESSLDGGSTVVSGASGAGGPDWSMENGFGNFKAYSDPTMISKLHKSVDCEHKIVLTGATQCVPGRS